jgi:hypothetical protein
MEGFSIRYGLPANPRRLGNTMLPREFTARWESPDDHTIEIVIRVQPVDVGGTKAERCVCESVRLDRNPARPPLDGLELRRLKLKEKIETACVAVAMREEPPGSGGWGPVGTQDEAAAALSDVRQSQRRRRITDELLRQVAAVFDEADGDMEQVRQKMFVSKAQAYRYVREARKRGHLPEAQQ